MEDYLADHRAVFVLDREVEPVGLLVAAGVPVPGALVQLATGRRLGLGRGVRRAGQPDRLHVEASVHQLSVAVAERSQRDSLSAQRRLGRPVGHRLIQSSGSPP